MKKKKKEKKEKKRKDQPCDPWVNSTHHFNGLGMRRFPLG